MRVPGLKYWSDQRIYFLCVATNEPADGENYNFIHQVWLNARIVANCGSDRRGVNNYLCRVERM